MLSNLRSERVWISVAAEDLHEMLSKDDPEEDDEPNGGAT